MMLGLSIAVKAHNLDDAQKMLNNSKSIEFIENKGQIADQNGNVNWDVLFVAEVPYGTVTIRRDGISCTFIKQDVEKLNLLKKSMFSKDVKKNDRSALAEGIPTETYRVDMRLKNSNWNPTIEKFEMAEDFNNYYLPQCPNGITQVRKFKTIKINDVYPNIDFVVYANNDGLIQYDFVVNPNANPEQINFVFEGASEVSISNEGNLICSTPLGNIEQKAPVSYQLNSLNNYLNSSEVSENATSISSQFKINTDNSISFALSNYNSSLPLIIDPPTRLWGTYYAGGQIADDGRVAEDGNGNVYLVGSTSSGGYGYSPYPINVYQINLRGFSDAILVKFNSSGVRQWCTYYGGSYYDMGHAVTTDNSGNIYLAGETYSTNDYPPYIFNMIATPNAYQTNLFGIGDAFLVKFNTNGERIWGTYYGDDDNPNADKATSVATDAIGNVYMAGTLDGFAAFLVKFSSDGTYQWNKYYSGNGSGGSQGNSVAIDAAGFVYLAGTTTTPIDDNDSNRIDTIYQFIDSTYYGNKDAYLMKFDSNGNRIWGRYYGGSNDDWGNGVSTDNYNNVYLVGTTQSDNNIATATYNEFQTSKSTGSDAFLVKFDSSGTCKWGTYYGGGGEDFGNAIDIDTYNNIFIGGTTGTIYALGTPGAHQVAKDTTYQYTNDAFLAKFDRYGARIWGTYYGGNSDESGNSVAIGEQGCVYLAGTTHSNNDSSIATYNGFQTTLGGEGVAIYLVKFEAPVPDVININLTSGWNLISSNVIPDYPDMSNVFDEIIPLNNGLIVRNDLNQQFTSGSNNIGDWNIMEGYNVYVTSTCTLRITGTRANPSNYNFVVTPGMDHFISYLPQYVRNTSSIFGSLSNYLLYVKDGRDNTYSPYLGLYTLNTMQPGKGYKIRTRNNYSISFIYPTP